MFNIIKDKVLQGEAEEVILDQEAILRDTTICPLKHKHLTITHII